MGVEEEIRSLSALVLAASVDTEPGDARTFATVLWPAACAAHRSLGELDADLQEWGAAMSDAAGDAFESGADPRFPQPPASVSPERADLAISVFAALGAGLKTADASTGWLRAALALPATTDEARRAQDYARALLGP